MGTRVGANFAVTGINPELYGHKMFIKVISMALVKYETTNNILYIL